MQHTIASDYAQRSLESAIRQRDRADAADPGAPSAEVLRTEVERWQIEVEGEQQLIDLLATLSDDYYGYSGVPSEVWDQKAGGLIDYVVIGPSGVFAMDARHWQRVTRAEFEREPDNIAEQSRKLSEKLDARITNAEVTPLIVLTNPKAELPTVDLPIGCVRASDLVGYLESASTRFDELTVGALAEMLGRTIETEREARHAAPTRVPPLPPGLRAGVSGSQDTNGVRALVPVSGSSVSLFSDPPSLSRQRRRATESHPRRTGLRWLALVIPLLVIIAIGYIVLRGRPVASSTPTATAQTIALGVGTPTTVPSLTTSPAGAKTPSHPVISPSVKTTLVTPTTPTQAPRPTNDSAVASKPGSTVPDTIGVFRNGTFFLRTANQGGTVDETIVFNVTGDPYPVTGDWLGQNTDRVGVFDLKTAAFSLCKATATADCANAANVIHFVFGNPGDQPVAGRWSDSQKTSGVGIFRAADGLFALKTDLNDDSSATTVTLGIPGDAGVLGDWTGQGYDSPGIFRRSTVSFLLSTHAVQNGQIPTDITASFYTRYRASTPQDIPVIGDWHGQGHDGVGLFHLGTFELRAAPSTGYPEPGFQFGSAGDVPVAGVWPTPAGN